MVVNVYFFSEINNIPHATPNYGPGIHKFEVDYYRQIYCYPETLARIPKNWKNQVKKKWIVLNASIMTTCSLLVMKHVKN